VNRIELLGSNCNQTRYTGTRYMWRGATIIADPATDADPWNILHNGTPAISAITPNTLAHGASNQTVTITGTNLDQLTTAVFSNAGITSTPDFTYGASSRTSLKLSVSVSAGATTGAGTVQAAHRFENSSNTLPFTVT
jgi:hypothetical protein